MADTIRAAGTPGDEPGALRKALSRAEARRQWRAFGLTLPLLVFLLLTLLVPIAALLQRAIENPEVANARGWEARIQALLCTLTTNESLIGGTGWEANPGTLRGDAYDWVVERISDCRKGLDRR